MCRVLVGFRSVPGVSLLTSSFEGLASSVTGRASSLAFFPSFGLLSLEGAGEAEDAAGGSGAPDSDCAAVGTEYSAKIPETNSKGTNKRVKTRILATSRFTALSQRSLGLPGRPRGSGLCGILSPATKKTRPITYFFPKILSYLCQHWHRCWGSPW
jgi:hypothetical protein